ncbi:acetylxylan esterase [Xylariales sp. PMI_506]|nr:acetylxylan esterase [Xylariales sp. PMI_506]
MWFRALASCLILCAVVNGTILQNGQVRITNYPDTQIDPSAYQFNTYDADASEISYKGRWDSLKVSWWAAAGLVFGFTGETVAITFGNWTVNTTLIAYRVAGEDWQFTNVTAGGTHLLVTSATPGVNLTYPVNPLTFELRVTNWGYGVQIEKIHVGAGERLIQLPNYSRAIEFIGDSLSAGMYTTYETLSGFAYAIGAGLGETEYSIVAYPGICAADQNCWGNPRGQVHQWFYTSDTSWRAAEIWGENPEPWDFDKHQKPDLVVINIGTNDANTANNVTTAAYVDAYRKLIEGVHGKYPDAQIIVMQLWIGFYQNGNSYAQDHAFDDELTSMVQYFNSPAYLSSPITWDGTTNTTSKLHGTNKPFVHLFNTTGIMQYNDIGPEYHPTDVGAVKVASHMLQYIRLVFGWDLRATGPEVLHDTLYWNDESAY